MKRPLGITLLVLLVSLLVPASASAGVWAWMEQWSGPGPFGGYTFLFTACVQDGTFKSSPIARDDAFHWRQEQLAHAIYDSKDPTGNALPEARILRRLLANPEPRGLFDRVVLLSTLNGSTLPPGVPATLDFGPSPERRDNPKLLPELRALYATEEADRGPGHEDRRLVCGYLDQGYFEAAANEDRGFPEIRAHLTDFGPSIRLHDGVDIGAGMGWVSFKGPGIDVGRHLTFTPIRVILRPITMAVPEVYRKRWMGVLNFYWKETYFVGKLNAQDFGSPTDPFAVNGELIRSVGLNFDITALFPPKWGFR
jgi:hypothetical protein